VRQILEALGVDYPQWRAITRALRLFHFIDVRSVQGGIGRLISFAVIFLLFGSSTGLIILRSRDPLLAGMALATNCAFLGVLIILTAYGGRLVSADDYQILGFRPVTSRTFLAIRVTAILFHALVVSALAALVPMACLAWRSGAVAPVVAAGVTCVLASMASALALIALYGWALGIAGAHRVKRWVSYLQVVVGFAWVAGYIVAIRLIVDDITLERPVDRLWWVWLYPGTWFGSYVSIASGDPGWSRWAGVSASIVCLAGLVAAVHGRMSLEYAERVAALDAGSSGPAAAQRSWHPRSFLSHETRAVALLVRAHFKSDMKFRLGLLSFLPMVAIYWFMGMDSGQPADPFAVTGSGGDSVMFVQMALLYLPQMVEQSMSTSETPLASWIFHSTPAGKARLVAATRNLVAACVLGPFLIALTIVFAYWFQNIVHAVVHVFFLGLMAHTVLMFAVWRDPKLPFSRQARKEPTGRFGLMMMLMIVGSILYAMLRLLVYRSSVLMAIFGAALVALNVWLDRLTRARVDRREREMVLE
jgi:hypothetical protein